MGSGTISAAPKLSTAAPEPNELAEPELPGVLGFRGTSCKAWLTSSLPLATLLPGTGLAACWMMVFSWVPRPLLLVVVMDHPLARNLQAHQGRSGAPPESDEQQFARQAVNFQQAAGTTGLHFAAKHVHSITGNAVGMRPAGQHDSMQHSLLQQQGCTS